MMRKPLIILAALAATGCTTRMDEVGRLPGFVQLSMLVPRDILERLGIVHLVEAQYGEPAGW